MNFLAPAEQLCIRTPLIKLWVVTEYSTDGFMYICTLAYFTSKKCNAYWLWHGITALTAKKPERIVLSVFLIDFFPLFFFFIVTTREYYLSCEKSIKMWPIKTSKRKIAKEGRRTQKARGNGNSSYYLCSLIELRICFSIDICT